MARNFEWWTDDHTFSTDMRILSLGAYDAILGMDWLKQHGDMWCNWAKRTLQFDYKGKTIKLQGIQTPTQEEPTEIPIDQVLKWSKGNDVWAIAVIEDCTSEPTTPVPGEIQPVLQQYTDVFSEPQALPPPREYDHAIALVPGAAPINARPYRYSPLHKDEIERQVNAMLQAGLIVPSMSPFASPVLLVQKKDGTWRFCIDYRRLNEITIRNTFPMPVIDELLDELAGSKLFSKLDLRAGYHQIRMREGDEEKTAFKTHHGHYQFRVMPFGLSNAPATFQCVMNSVLQPCLRKFVLVFMDDILIYSPSLPEHVRHLSLVLDLLRQHQLFVKESKCSFAQTQLEYLGHIVSAEGVATDPKKTAAMVAWPRPTTVTELRGFLGLTGYYRKFVRAYGILAKPLTNLLKRKAFEWSAEAEEAFLALKTAMSTTPVLTLPDFSKQFVVETDACDAGVGAVLMQDGHPIAFLSKALSLHHKSLSIYEKEFLALIMAVERWRSYLQRGEFIIKTDHQSLTYLEDQTLHSTMQRKAMARLMGLQFRIKYKKGVDNTAADSLSRVAAVLQLHAVSAARPAWIQEVINSYVTDSEAQAKIQALAVSSPDEQGYSLCNGLIKLQERVWIGNNTALQTKLISAFHSSAIGGHSGILPTYQRLKRMFAWQGMKVAVENFIKQCSICQHAKHEHTKPAGLLQPLPLPAGIWRELTMDFVEGLPLSGNANVIMVVVDRLSKYAHFVPLKHPFTVSVADAFLDNVVKLHSVPLSIVSDRDKIFTSQLWKELFKSMGTNLHFSTAYHPQTDGQTERVNQCMEMYLRCMVHGAPKQWRKWLPLAELWYNSTFHSSLGCSPFKAVYGCEPNFGLLPVEDTTIQTDAATMLAERQQQLDKLKSHLAAAQLRMKLQADKNRTEKEYQVGEQVLLKLQPYAQSSLVNRPYPKLAFKFFGPYKILERIGKVAYKLDLPDSSAIHPVFHVSQLKNFVPDHSPVFSTLPVFPELDTGDPEPEEILERRLVKKGNAVVPQGLIKWKGIAADSATWEDINMLKERFPAARAWGQARSPGEAGVTTTTRYPDAATAKA